MVIFSFSLGKSEVKFECSKRGRSFTFEVVNATPDICLKPDATFKILVLVVLGFLFFSYSKINFF